MGKIILVVHPLVTQLPRAKAAQMQCPGLGFCLQRYGLDGSEIWRENQLKGFEVGSLSHCLHVSFTSQVVIAGCLPSTVDLRKFA